MVPLTPQLNSIEMDSPNTNKEETQPLVMQSVQQLFGPAMISRYNKAFSRIEGHLRNEARCTKDMSVREACVIAIESANDKCQEMVDCFGKNLSDEFRLYQKTVTQPKESSRPISAIKLDLSHLSLVEEDSLQESIDIQTMVANTLRSCEYLLVPIGSGIARAYGVNKVDQHCHALSPTRIGEWLQQSLGIGKFQGVARHAIYQIFREELFDTLAPLYKEVIDIFQQHSINLAMQQSKSYSLNINTLMAHPVDLGFGPSASLSVEEQKKRRIEISINDNSKSTKELTGKGLVEGGSKSLSIDRNVTAGESTNNEMVSKENPETPKFIGVDAWIEVNSLPQKIRFPDGYESNINDSYGLSDISSDDDRTLISVSARQLDDVLASIQLQMLRDETDWVEKLRQYLRSRTDKHELCVINPAHENIMRLINHTLNLICQVFHPGVARYLNSLRIAFVRMAILDKTFLSSSLHPGKSLFDAIAYLSYGLNPGNKRIVKQLFRMVRSFYEIGVGEGPTLEQLQYELIGFIEAERQRTFENERESLQELYNQEQRYLAFKTADAFINARFSSMSRVLEFHELLHVVLRRVLAESYLNGGSDSEDWRKTTQLFNALAWTTQAKASEENKHRILRALPQLLLKLGNFFKKHNIPLDMQSLINKQINEIQKLIVAGRDGNSICNDDLKETATIRYLLSKVRLETKESYRQKMKIGSDHQCERPFSDSGAKPLLEPGQWLVYLVDDGLLMCKYVFHFAPLDKFVFVNWEGEKQFERESGLVEKDITTGYAQLLSMPVPFESALRHVISQAQSKVT